MDTMTSEWQREAREYLSGRHRVADSGCWEWALARSNNGYGKAKFQGVQVSAHRLSYLAFFGSIGDGLHIDHLCMNKPCINPAHLEAVTPRTNIRRAVYAYLGRNYSLCLTGRGLWQSSFDLGGSPRQRKVFRSKDRDMARQKVLTYIESLDA